jgi:phosphonoacetate hydrolase
VYAKDPADIDPMIDYISGLAGIEDTLSRPQASAKLGLPEDREADIVVISSESCVLGSCASEHDLSTVGDRPLRSHGGYSEQSVPFMLSQPMNEQYLEYAKSTRLRNFDIFDFALNGTL